MSKSRGYPRFYGMETYSFIPMEEVFITDVWYAYVYCELKKEYLKARNAVLPQFQVESSERARIFYIISDLQEESGIDRYSYFHSICESQKFTYIDSMTQKEITFEVLQCHDYIFLSDYKYRFKNPQSGEWTFLTIKTYADEYEKMFINGDPAKLELTEKRRVLSKFLHHICVQLPTPFPWVDPDIPEVFDDFYMEDVWYHVMTCLAYQ